MEKGNLFYISFSDIDQSNKASEVLKPLNIKLMLI